MMPDWRKVLGGVDRLVLRAADLGWRVLLWPAVYALALAAAMWPLLHSDRIRDWGNNELTHPERITQLNYLLGALGLMATLLLGFLVLGRVRTGEWRLWARARTFNRFFAFLLAGPFVVALTVPRIEVQRPFFTMLFIGLATLSVLPTIAVLWELAPRWRQSALARPVSRLGAFAPASIVVGLFAGYGYWFSRLSINSHQALQTRIYDLAIYDNIFYKSSHGEFLGCSLCSTGSHIHGHFDPILQIISPVYLLAPRAETILALQAVWCAAGVFPAYLLGRHHLGSKWAGVTLAIAWALYPALHGANSYEFHSLTLLAMPMMWLMYFLTAERFRSFFVLLPFVLLIREDVSLLVCGVAFTAILTRDPRLARVGWITLVISAAYFVVTKAVIMAGVSGAPGTAIEHMDPLGGKHGFAWYYTDLIPKGGGLRDLLIVLLTNPMFALELALKELKLVFLLQLLLPLVFLPLVAKPWRFAMAFGLFYILLATRRAVYQIHFQYSVVLFPVLFALAPIGLKRLRNSGLPSSLGLRRSQIVAVLLAALLVSSVLMSWKFGGIFANDSFKGGWQRPPRELSSTQVAKLEQLRGFIAEVPPDAAITVVGRVGPHLSNRADVYKYRHRRPSDYLVFDSRDLKGWIQKDFKKRLKAGKLELVHKAGTFELYRELRKVDSPSDADRPPDSDPPPDPNPRSDPESPAGDE